MTFLRRYMAVAVAFVGLCYVGIGIASWATDAWALAWSLSLVVAGVVATYSARYWWSGRWGT